MLSQHISVSFCPPLRATTRVPSSTAARVLFRATLSDELYAEFVEQDVHLQVWIQVHGSRKWTAIPFQPAWSWPPSNTDDREVHTKTLDDEGTTTVSENRELVATALVSHTVPFTYRAVYASGHIHWFGTDNGNGLLEIQPPYEDTLDLDEEGRSFDQAQDVVVGHIQWDKHSNAWAVVGGSVLPIQNSVSRASTLILVPQIHANTLILPQPHILHCTTPTCSFSISPAGQVTFHSDGQGSIRRITYDDPTTLPDSLPTCQVLKLRPQSGLVAHSNALVLRSGYPNSSTSTYAILPLDPDTPPEGWNARVTISSLTPTTPTTGTPPSYLNSNTFQAPTPSTTKPAAPIPNSFAFFCHRTKQFGFYTLASHADTDLQLKFGARGGCFVVCPVYALGAWEVAVAGVSSSPVLVMTSGSAGDGVGVGAGNGVRPKRSLRFSHDARVRRILRRNQVGNGNGNGTVDEKGVTKKKWGWTSLNLRMRCQEVVLLFVGLVLMIMRWMLGMPALSKAGTDHVPPPPPRYSKTVTEGGESSNSSSSSTSENGADEDSNQCQLALRIPHQPYRSDSLVEGVLKRKSSLRKVTRAFYESVPGIEGMMPEAKKWTLSWGLNGESEGLEGDKIYLIVRGKHQHHDAAPKAQDLTINLGGRAVRPVACSSAEEVTLFQLDADLHGRQSDYREPKPGDLCALGGSLDVTLKH